MTVALTDRDRAILHTAWSLGAATSATLRALISPRTSPDTFTARLKKLVDFGHLRVQRYVARDGGLWLYSSSDVNAWRPSLSQVEHTLDVCRAVVALTRPGFGAPLQVSAWQGEAELRAWAAPGAPFPDAVAGWTSPSRKGRWLVEVDRSTESRAAWRRKLVRYLSHPGKGHVLALTRSHARAAHLAQLAADLGVPLLAAPLTVLEADPDPVVLDAGGRSRRRLSVASTDASSPPS